MGIKPQLLSSIRHRGKKHSSPRQEAFVTAARSIRRCPKRHSPLPQEAFITAARSIRHCPKKHSPQGEEAFVDPGEAKMFLRELDGVVKEGQAKEVLMTVADYLRAEGREEGQKNMLLRLLRTRFGALPEAYVEKVSRASLSEIERWAERILSGTTVEDVLA